MQRYRILLALSLALIGWVGPVHAEVLYLQCTYHYSGGVLRLYTTIDIDRKLAKFSAEPADDLRWRAAEIDGTTIRWSNPPTYETYVLNRYSLHLDVYRQHPRLGPQRQMLSCARSGAPRRRI
jgi:hypothetical protein